MQLNVWIVALVLHILLLCLLGVFHRRAGAYPIFRIYGYMFTGLWIAAMLVLIVATLLTSGRIGLGLVNPLWACLCLTWLLNAISCVALFVVMLLKEPAEKPQSPVLLGVLMCDVGVGWWVLSELTGEYIAG